MFINNHQSTKMKRTIIAALLLGTAFTASAQQTTIYSQDFEGSSEEIFEDGWDVIDFSGESPDGGIFNSNAQIEEKGFSGKTIGLLTFESNEGTLTNMPNTDAGVKTEDYILPEGASSVSFKLGGIGYSGGAVNHYSIYIMTAEEYNGLGTAAQLGAYLDTKTAVETGNVTGNAVTKTFDLSAYAEKTVSLIFRLHDGTGNTILLVDDVVVKSGTLSSGDFSASQFAVYPNPASNSVSVAAQNNTLKGVTIADLNGRIVASHTFNSIALADISIEKFTAGTYIMTISSESGNVSKKIVKQ